MYISDWVSVIYLYAHQSKIEVVQCKLCEIKFFCVKLFQRMKTFTLYIIYQLYIRHDNEKMQWKPNHVFSEKNISNIKKNSYIELYW